MLVISIKLAGDEAEDAGEVESELPHLKGMKKRSRRLPVRLRVSVDGQIVHEGVYEPRGVRGDSASVGTVELPVEPGKRIVTVELDGSPRSDTWAHVHSREVEFSFGRRRVVQFEDGFHWDGE